MLVGIAFAALAAPPAFADVETFTVDDAGDAPDASLNNGVCATAGAVCTLRAALQEADDADPATDLDTINFSAGVQGAAITIGSQLPTINEPTTVDACSSPNNGACVGVIGVSTAVDAFRVEGGGSPVTIRGFAITNSQRGIAALTDTDNLTVRNNWFGIKIDGTTAQGNDTGVTVTADNAVIGGTAVGDRNVFANNAVGLDVFVGDDAQVLGNFFGTNVAGTAAAANSTNIGLDGNGSDPASDAIIGGTQPTPGTCSGPCNVISGATTNGINLKTSSQDASGTTISGNFIGLNAAGTAAIGNSMGIRLANAPNTTVGGGTAGERNFITGGTSAIFGLFQGAPGLEVTNNFIGTNLAGTAPLSPPSDFGITAVSVQADPAAITDNLIALNTTTGVDAITAQGNGATIAGNLIGVGPGGEDLGVGGLGIRTIKLDNAAISDNTVGNFSVSGITLEGDAGTTVAGNLVGTDSEGGNQGGGTRGIQVSNNGTTASTGNTIGGNLAPDENVISNMSFDAIEVVNASDLQVVPSLVENDSNVIARNRGSNNGSTADALFIDLVDSFTPAGNGPGNPNTGPNNGVQAPTVTVAGGNDAGGTATAGATVRVFSKATASPGEVQGFLGSATAAGNGTWALAYASPVANGTRVVATQTDGSDTSELSGAVVTDAIAPDTQINSGPSGPTSDVTPSFAFSSEPGAVFECRMDGGAFAPCTSAFTAAPLADGSHTFRVRAVDADLNRDGDPAVRSFEVDTVAPGTTITGGPKGRVRSKTRRKKVSFRFISSEPGVGGFQCQIDGRPFVLCTSPFTRRLKRGKHTFRVRAFDGAGNPDPSLAVRSFRILRPRR